ncbi:MAG: pitrilysin family protein [Proteobacteria bacterium]|nr:pitrilysin family protein [Pseudomonadota bacterium]
MPIHRRFSKEPDPSRIGINPSEVGTSKSGNYGKIKNIKRIFRVKNLRFFGIFLICSLFLFPFGVSAQERKASLQTGRLANGIRVVVEEDHSAPLFAIQAWIRAGSVNEEEDQAGLAHLLEHMLFRRIMPPGSEPGKLAEQVESAGGDINAYTSPDCTVVHLVLPSASSEKGFQAIASVFSGPDFNPSDLEEEKKVVIEEINRSEDLPEGLLMKRLFSESFWVHPYGRPVIGNWESVERFTVQDLESFFRKYYRPERVVISVAGDLPTPAGFPEGGGTGAMG